jgi:molybdopterin converting factor small subunit
MSITVHLYSSLQQYTGGHDIVEAEGKTVGECLNDLVTQYPEIKPSLFAEDGELSKGVFVSINLESPYSENLSTPIKNNANLYLILILAGG